MEKILKYLCALVLIVMISATTVNVMTVKPATPKVVLIKTFTWIYHSEEYIRDGFKKGYTLKGVYSDGRSNNVLVVMEKY